MTSGFSRKISLTFLLTAVVQTAWGATIAPAAPLSVARADAVAALLPNGEVLVAGGNYLDSQGVDQNLASVEIYDPVANSWSSAASMSVPRSGAVSVMLANGKLLVMSGADINGDGTGEFYDPAANTWSPAGSLNVARRGFTMTLLPNGKVLATGGAGVIRADEPADNSHLHSAELYDPAANTWSFAASMAIGRTSHTATLLTNGQVLVAGGYSEGVNFYENTTEFYDPDTDMWRMGPSFSTPRIFHSANLLNDGSVLIARGFQPDPPYFAIGAERYDPLTGLWSSAGNCAIGGTAFTNTLLPNGEVLLTGGDFKAGTQPASSQSVCEVYDPGANSWSTIGNLAQDRESHTATLLNDGRVLVATGVTAVGDTVFTVQAQELNSAELIDLRAPAPPVFTSGTHVNFVIGRANSFTVTTTGMPVAAITASGNLPRGVTFADNHNGTATLSGMPTGASKKYELTLTADNGTPPKATQPLGLVTLVIPASSDPIITSGPTATPNPAAVGKAVVFTVATQNPGDGTLTYSWDFGDGSTGSGASISHAYMVQGDYIATVTVAADLGLTSSIVAVTVVGSHSPPFVGTGADSDGDGFSDSFETSFGTVPNDPASVPFALSGTPGTLTKAAITAKLDFSKQNNDSFTLSGVLAVPASFASSGAKLALTVGSFVEVFMLDAKGHAKSGTDSVVVALKSGGAAQMSKFTIKLNKKNLQASLSIFGLTNKDAAKTPVTLTTDVVFANALFITTVAEHYSAKLGKTGATAK